MTRAIALSAAVLSFLYAPSTAAQNCPTSRLDQRTYQAFGERLVVYVGDINSRSGGWSAFSLRILVGTYRRPFLASSGALTETGLDQLLAQRRDIIQQKLPVPAHDPRSGRAKDLGKAVSVKVDGRPVSIRVVDVRPVSGGTDHLLLEVCGAR
jgi:hypothetical protein